MQKLDLSVIAELHLLKTLVKTKSIASAPLFPKYIKSKVERSSVLQDAAYVNVTARLYNSNPVKTAMEGIMNTVRTILGVEKMEPLRKKRLRAADFGERAKALKDPVVTIHDGPRSKEENIEVSDNEFTYEVQDVGSQIDTSGSEDDCDHLDQYASRLANSSSDESPSSPPSKAQENGQTSYMPHESLSSPPPLDSRASQKSTTKSRPKSTTFLPSLTLGGYYSGSESGSSAFDDEDQSAAAITARKNRRGQRARRQLWEKKFGQKANHLRNQTRDQGWDARKGALGENGGRGRGGRREGGRGRGGGRDGRVGGSRGSKTTGANSELLKTRAGGAEAKKDGPLHPSWEAAKKRKEAKVGAAFEGKKIVFD